MEFDPNLKARLLFQLNEILPAECILTAEEDLRPYECDGLTAYRRVPLAVVLPTTIEQIQAITRACNSLNIPVVARGAGTGLSGGALPDANGIVLGLSRFNQILDIDTDNLTARVQPGVPYVSSSPETTPIAK